MGNTLPVFSSMNIDSFNVCNNLYEFFEKRTIESKWINRIRKKVDH